MTNSIPARDLTKDLIGCNVVDIKDSGIFPPEVAPEVTEFNKSTGQVHIEHGLDGAWFHHSELMYC